MAELTEEEVKRRMADAQRRYLAAGHAVQTAVLFNMERGARSHEPKHLRTGLDMRAADAAEVAGLATDCSGSCPNAPGERAPRPWGQTSARAIIKAAASAIRENLTRSDMGGGYSSVAP